MLDAHLLFKFHHFPWGDSSAGVTIDKHIEVIKKHGKVWWGRTTGISREKAESLKLQIKDGIPTYAFLYAIFVPKKTHPDTNLWFRAKVVDLTLGKPESTELIPEYYRDKNLEFYCLLTDIEPIAFAPGETPRVPGQAAIRHVSYTGTPKPENLTFFGDTSKKICKFQGEVGSEEPIKEKLSGALSGGKSESTSALALRVIDLQEEMLQLKDEISQLKTYKDFYNRILNTDYLFSSEKFFETWIQENMHRIYPEFEILDRQPGVSWPDGKFGRLDLLAVNKETKELVIIEVKTRKRSKKSGYDQFLRYTSWARRNIEALRSKYPKSEISPTDEPHFVIISDYVDDEMQAICKDHGISLVHVFGGLGIERAA